LKRKKNLGVVVVKLVVGNDGEKKKKSVIERIYDVRNFVRHYSIDWS
jgi:hypothetical protein